MKSVACALGLALVIALVPVQAREQAAEDSLVAARGLYAEAAYEDALSMLDRLDAAAGSAGGERQRDVQLTRALCLVALKRDAEARAAMEAVVTLDPSFDLDPAQASPRVRDLFRSVRGQRLPIIIRDRYAGAKQAFDEKNYELASKRFAEVSVLLDDPVVTAGGARAGLADLRTLISGFSDLCAQLQAPAIPQREAAIPAASIPSARASFAVGATGDGAAPAPVKTSSSATPQPTDGAATDPIEPGHVVVAPVAIEQQAPAWSPSLGLVRGRTYKATVRVIIDETGKVTSANIVESVNRIYDQSLLDAVRRWRYQPGTRDGVPIPFTKVVTVTVEAHDPSPNR